MATPDEVAYDAVLTTFRNAWNAQTPAIVGQANPALVIYADAEWRGRPEEKNPSTDSQKAWCRVDIQLGKSGTTSLPGAVGTRRYESMGTINVQVFVREVSGSGAPMARALARVVRVAFQGKRVQNVVFYTTETIDVGRDSPWYQMNVAVEFRWSEVR